jgi:hypothetical protein
MLAAQAEQFSYCQSWMLAWGYRKQNLLKELLNYNADIMCLQVNLPSVNGWNHAPVESLFSQILPLMKILIVPLRCCCLYI